MDGRTIVMCRQFPQVMRRLNFIRMISPREASGTGGGRPLRSGIGALAPTVTASALVVAGNRNYTTSVQGSTSAWLTVRGWSLASGRTFSDAELSGSSPACQTSSTRWLKCHW